MTIWVINGPNINLLGLREPELYGREDYAALVSKILAYGESHGIDIEVYQSNHEGDLVDKIQAAYGKADGLVLNPGAYTHTSIALLDALKSVSIPAVEVHITDVNSREPFRRVSYVREACCATISGHGTDGYLEAIALLAGKTAE